MSIKLMVLVFDTALPPDKKIIMLALADYAADDGESIYPSKQTLSAKTSIKERMLQRYVAELIDQDKLLIIKAIGGGRKTTSYRIDVNRLREIAKENEQPCHTRHPTRVTHDTAAVSPMTQNPLLETSIEPSLTESKKTLSEAKERKLVRVRDQRLDHPALIAYRKFTRLYVPVMWRDDVAQVENNNLWQTVVKDWVGYGWNPGNVKGMLEAYKSGGIKRKNGNGKSAYKIDDNLSEWEEYERLNNRRHPQDPRTQERENHGQAR